MIISESTPPSGSPTGKSASLIVNANLCRGCMSPSRHFADRVSFSRFLMLVAFLLAAGWPSFAKTPGLSAIEVYPAENGPGYVEISNFFLNTKNEVHLCGQTPAISKNAYEKLPKLSLSAGMSLERAQNGMLWLTRPGGAPECVVPANVKDLGRRESETPAELAERTELQGDIVSSSIASTRAIPRMAPGTKVVLVDVLDNERAEFLLAESARTIGAWRSYLEKFPKGANVGQARADLAVLYVRSGKESLTQYQAAPKDAKSVDKLMAAKDDLDQAHALAPRNQASEDLAAGIHQEAQVLDQRGLGELALFREALKKETPGYNHLLNAEELKDQTLRLDPNSIDTVSLATEDTNVRRILDNRFVNFDNNLDQSHPEEAYEWIKPLRALAPEYPEIQKRLDHLYSYYLEAGKKDESKQDFQDEVVQYRKALAVEPRPEMAEMLQAAEKKAQDSSDEAAIRTALSQSSGAEEDKDYVTAYEVLINLTPERRRKQQAVADRLAALQDTYMQKAPAEARGLQKDNTPLKGPPNEVALERAYDLMRHCFDLKNDPDINDSILTLGHSLSTYDLEQAQNYLSQQDPLSSHIGWAYLAKASHYKVLDEEALQSQIKSITDAHQAESIPSISIKFKDTSSPGSAGDFPTQLVRSTAASIASYSPKIKVFGPEQPSSAKPTFALVGEARVIEAEAPRTGVDPASAADTNAEHVNHLRVTVQLSFQIEDSSGKTVLTGTPVSKTEETLIRTLDGVIPGDTSVRSVTGGLSKPQFIEEVEGEARDALLPEIRRSVANLPKTILALADQRAAAGDTAGAAALYMLYLDSTPQEPSPDWSKAQKFLSDNYDFRAYGETPQA
jgi:hypothetical protein